MIKLYKWTQQFDGITENDIPADPLGDLRTQENKLSVWVLPEESSLSRIVVALAASRDELIHFDYALFNSDVLIDIGIEQLPTEGKSVDIELNEQFHYNLIKISGDKLLKLAKHIYNLGEVKRIMNKEVARYIADAIERGQVDKDNIKFIDKVNKIVSRSANNH